MTDADYYNRDTIDAKLDSMYTLISDFKDQNNKDMKELSEHVGYTNGKVKRHEKILIAVGAVVITLLIVNGSKFTDFLASIVF